MVHSRTIREAAAHFREVDPNTSLTETAIRNLLRQGPAPAWDGNIWSQSKRWRRILWAIREKRGKSPKRRKSLPKNGKSANALTSDAVFVP